MNIDSHVPLPIHDAFATPYEPASIRTLGSVYWTTLIILFAVTFVFSIVLGVWEFTRPMTADSASGSSVGVKRSLNKTELRTTVEGLEKRAQAFEERLVSPLPLKDPS